MLCEAAALCQKVRVGEPTFVTSSTLHEGHFTSSFISHPQRHLVVSAWIQVPLCERIILVWSSDTFFSRSFIPYWASRCSFSPFLLECEWVHECVYIFSRVHIRLAWLCARKLLIICYLVFFLNSILFFFAVIFKMSCLYISSDRDEKWHIKSIAHFHVIRCVALSLKLLWHMDQTGFPSASLVEKWQLHIFFCSFLPHRRLPG